jgi:dTDP-4-dehydrorhamnose reductase
MKIVVLGANGMAGHVVTKYLKQQGHDVTEVTRNQLDVENQIRVENFFTILNPDIDFVINCIGLLVKDSIDRPDRAIMINSWFPHYMEQQLLNRKTKIIHLSTDCVFNGADGSYLETDVHTETNFYGKSKSLGEINNNKDITFRMSIIGPELKNGTGLFNWFVKNSPEEVDGWVNAWWNGITTLELAKCINKYINDPTITGVYHLVNNYNEINKYELLVLINEIFSLNKMINPIRGPKHINKVLVNTRQEIDFEIPNYRIMLTELKDFIVT